MEEEFQYQCQWEGCETAVEKVHVQGPPPKWCPLHQEVKLKEQRQKWYDKHYIRTHAVDGDGNRVKKMNVQTKHIYL